MENSNSSRSSVDSNREKCLPSVPNDKRSLQRFPEPEESILKEKTLKRKNFKKLSLSTPSCGPKVNETADEYLAINSVYSKRAIKVRPAPLAGLRDSTDSFNINRSNRAIDPDAYSSPRNVLNQLSSLEISQVGLASQRNSVGARKRQTVISSISPTKSSSESSPSESNKVLHTVCSSPLVTTSSIVLSNEDLFPLKELGSGNSGTVSKVLHVPTEKIMAKKVIHIDLKTVIQTQIIRELRTLHECQSPFIIDFFGAFINSNNTIVLCMEYCNCGSLDNILSLCEPRRFPLYALKKLTYSILSGLTYLYLTHKIIHRDIKPSNVLMTHKGQFKLCDFGVLRELTNSLGLADTFVGTSTYMSPERIQGLKYGVKSDVWSMGLMLIELATGNFVWNDDEGGNNQHGPEGILDLLQRIVNEPPPTLSNKIDPISKRHYDSELCVFVDSCLIKDDHLRMSPSELLEAQTGFLVGVAEGVYDHSVKLWAKNIRKMHKNRDKDKSLDDLIPSRAE